MGRIKTPCIGICSVSQGDDICRGCGRTLIEIRNWGRFDDADRDMIMAQLPYRLENPDAAIPTPSAPHPGPRLRRP